MNFLYCDGRSDGEYQEEYYRGSQNVTLCLKS